MSEEDSQPDGASRALSLFEDFALRLGQGEQVDIEELCGEHPELADELRQLHDQWRRSARLLARLALTTGERLRQRFGTEVDPQITLRTPATTVPAVASDVVARLAGRKGAFGRYRIDGEVARGGMGTILKVRDQDLQRDLAMKVLHHSQGLDPQLDTRAVGRFLEEAQITSQLDHPGIVPVHEIGIASDGEVYFTMKLVQGRDLRTVFDLARAGAEDWTLTRAVGVLLRVCEAMAFAHDKGVVHRDLKPANVMVGSFGEVYVMDWGLARVMDRDDLEASRPAPARKPGPRIVSERSAQRDATPDSPLLTHEGDVLGTPAYMSPEQALGRASEVGPVSDVYAAGAMLYQLLTGHPPYGEGTEHLTPHAVLQRVRDRAPATLQDRAPTAPAELVAICNHAMARDPGARYPDMAALGTDLRAWLEGRVVGAYETGAWAEFRKWVARNRRVAALAAALLLCMPVLVGLAVYIGSTRDEVRAAESAARRERLEGRMEKGFLALGEDRREAALADFLAVATEDPGSPVAFAGTVLTLLRMEDYPRAARLCEERADLVRRVPMLAGLHADALRALGRTSEADAIDGELPAPTTALEHYLIGLRDLPETSDNSLATRTAAQSALAAFDKAVARAPRARPLYHYGRAQAVSVLRDRDLALDLDENLYELWPEAVSALAWRSFALLSANDIDAALPLLRLRVQAQPDDAFAHGNLAGALNEIQDHDGALAAMRRAVELAPEIAAYHGYLGYCLFRTGETSQALDVYRHAEGLDSDDPEIAYGLGKCLWELGDRADAIQAYRRAAELREMGFRAPRSFALIGGRDWGSNLFNHLGYALFDEGDAPGAIAAYRKALDLDPHDYRAHYNLANALGATRDPDFAETMERAIAELRAAVEREPESSPPWVLLANALQATGDVDGSIEARKKTISLEPSAIEHHRLGNLYSSRGDLEEAGIQYRAALDLDPKDFGSCNNLAIVRIRQQRFDDAIEVLREALTLRPGEPNAGTNLALLLQGRGDMQQAADQLRAVLDAHPDFAPAHYNLAETLWIGLNESEEAESCYRRFLELQADDPAGNLKLGLLLKQQARFADALPLLEKAHQLGSGQPSWRYPSAEHVAECRQAIERDDRVAAYRADPSVVDSTAELLALAMHCHEKRWYAQGVALFESAFAKNPALAEDLEAGHRYDAACCAARAGNGDDRGPDAPAPQDLQSLSAKAITWLGADLAVLEAARAAGDLGATALTDRLTRWSEDPDLTGLRDPGLSALPAELRTRCRALWRRVAEHLE